MVADSLEKVGMGTLPSFSSLVETTRQRDLDVVMVQNAWNVIPRREFWVLLRPYPLGWKARAVARRLVAHWNFRRARKVVCLTAAIAELVRPYSKGRVVVTPVACPLGFALDSSSRPLDPVKGTCVVVGSLTWYKRPWLALEVVHRQAPEIKHVTFLGAIDQPRIWSLLQQYSSKLGITIEQEKVSHAEMAARYGAAAVTVLPSALESLGFGVVEALVLGNRVLAADIPAHRDAARALGGRQPEWFDDSGNLVRGSGGVKENGIDALRIETQWRLVRDEMLSQK